MFKYKTYFNKLFWSPCEVQNGGGGFIMTNLDKIKLFYLMACNSKFQAKRGLSLIHISLQFLAKLPSAAASQQKETDGNFIGDIVGDFRLGTHFGFSKFLADGT